MIALLLLGLLIASGCKNMRENNQKQSSLPLDETNQTTELPFQEIDSHGFNELLNPENIPAQKVIFRDQKSWQMFWEKYGKEAAPQIDFTKYVVVGVFLGPKPNPGYGVEIAQIQKSGSEISIHIIGYIANPKYDYPSVIVYPYHIVFFPKTEGEIVFTVEQKIRDEE